MSRITKYEPSPNSKFPYKLKDDSLATELDCIHKLGILEDFEEELGCPLNVLFKVLKQDYIYTKSGKHLCLELGVYGGIWCICYETTRQIIVNDYKKSWWLKEDRSE